MRLNKIILHKREVIIFWKKITDKHINALKLNSLKETKVLLIVIPRHHSSSQLFTPEALRQATFHSLGANIINVPLNPSQYLYDMYFYVNMYWYMGPVIRDHREYLVIHKSVEKQGAM